MNNPVGFALFLLVFMVALVFLPKFRRVMGWIAIPPVMVLILYPRTRKPALGLLGAVVVVAGGVWFLMEYRRRTYWYCDVYRSTDHSLMVGRSSEMGLACYKGEDACLKAHVNADGKPYDDSVLAQFFINEGGDCGHRYSSLWSYDYVAHGTPGTPHAGEPVPGTEQFSSLEECQRARGDNLKNSPSVCTLVTKP